MGSGPLLFYRYTETWWGEEPVVGGKARAPRHTPGTRGQDQHAGCRSLSTQAPRPRFLWSKGGDGAGRITG